MYSGLDRTRPLLTVPLEKQTVAFNIKARVDFKSRRRARMGVWEAIELLNTLVDESDPDVSDFIQEVGNPVALLTDSIL